MNGLNRLPLFFSMLVFRIAAVPGQDLPAEQVEVVKQFEARLTDAQKIVLKPEPEVREVEKAEFQYIVTDRTLDLDYLPPTIKPISIIADPVPDVYKGFLKAGAGYPLSGYLDVGYTIAENDKSSLVGRLRHHSANDKEIENQRFVDNDLFLKGTIITNRGFAIDGNVQMSLDEHYFYGYERQDTSFDRDQVQHKLNLYNVGLNLYNARPTQTHIDYWAKLDVYRLTNNYATNESGLALDLGLTKWLGTNAINVNLKTDLSRLKDTAIHNLNNFELHPSYRFFTRQFRLELGGRLATAQEEYYVFPAIELKMMIAGNGLSVFAGADGNLMKNSYRMLSEYNPYLVSEISGVRNTRYFDFYGGIKGQFAGLDYEVRVGYKPTEDHPLFKVNTDKPYYRFNIVYDTISISYLKGSVRGNFFKFLDVEAGVAFNHYETDLEEEAWYLPGFQFDGAVTYSALEDRLRVRSDIYFIDRVEYQELPFGDKPNLIFDVSLSVDYLITQKIGVFGHLNNLAAQRYRRWYNYPSYGINVLGGIIIRF